ncbi:MAG: patatin-like protein [Gordonia sp. (in: high G+C Gram-positive bacteria)]
MPTARPSPDVIELRLALVCYGGVSLAVYMHGITKELHKLVRASRAVDAARAASSTPVNPFRDPDHPPTPAAGADSEAVYFDVLHRLEQAGHPLSVAIDIIGGTSAGGINGVVLAKAIATNADQGALRDLWINAGDLRRLLRAPAVVGPVIQAALAVAWTGVTAWRRTSLLRSEVMSRNLFHALHAMDDTVGGEATARSLIPPGRRLQLFVTTTDQAGFDVVVPSGAGGIGQRDRAFAQVMAFQTRHTDPMQVPTGLGPDHTDRLAFAARATSAFPGAFAPVSRSGFIGEVGRSGGRPLRLGPDEFGELFRYRYPDDPVADAPHPRWWQRLAFRRRPATDTERRFIDGGLLDNAPFDLIIDSIAREKAAHQVIRRLVYIEPDPGKPLTAAVAAYRRHSRSFLADLMGVKGPLTSHSFLRDLLRLREMNERIANIGHIAERQRAEVEQVITARVLHVAQDMRTAADRGGDPVVAPSFVRQLAEISDAKRVSDIFYDQAEDESSYTWRTYQRLKALAIAERVATAVITVARLPTESTEAECLRSALAAHMRARPEWQIADMSLVMSVLKPLDTPYRERRLMFIIDGINQLYQRDDGPDRTEIDQLKQSAWGLLSAIQLKPEEVIARRDTSALIAAATGYAARCPDRHNPTDSTATPLPAPLAGLVDELFAHYAQGLTELGNDNEIIWDRFHRAIAASIAAGAATGTLGGGWTDDHFRSLAARYLGFPRWDAALFPIMSLSEIPQLAPIPVSQFSPLEATTLRTRVPGRPPLFGAGLAHFGAFLKPGFRESDYLFGRLDGADLIIRLLAETTGHDGLADDAAAALAAIHRTEAPGLTHLPRRSRRWLSACFSAGSGTGDDAARVRTPRTQGTWSATR